MARKTSEEIAEALRTAPRIVEGSSPEVAEVLNPGDTVTETRIAITPERAAEATAALRGNKKKREELRAMREQAREERRKLDKARNKLGTWRWISVGGIVAGFIGGLVVGS